MYKSTAPSIKARALAYLSRREHSRAELHHKLTPYATDADEDELEQLLSELERAGWLSDARFAESLVYRRAPRFGAKRIINELKQHAVDDTLVQKINKQLHDTEGQRAQTILRKKYAARPSSFAERAKQARFLAMRGFSYETIKALLDER